MIGTFTTRSEEETLALAARLAAGLTAGMTLLLFGDLGAGKTAFVRGLAAGLGIDPLEVTSPTFTLVHDYPGGRLPLQHVDLYRLDAAELDEVGLDPELAEQGVVAIEWAERLVRAPQNAVRVTLTDTGESTRTITVSPPLEFN